MLELVIMDAFTKIKFVNQEQDNMIICQNSEVIYILVLCVRDQGEMGQKETDMVETTVEFW